MHKSKAVIEYWQQCAIQEALMEIQPARVYSSWHAIDRKSLQQGKIIDNEVLAKLLAHGSSMLVIPYYARSNQQYFFPFMLQVEIDAEGKFQPLAHTALPIFPHFTLESSAMQPIILTSAEHIADYLALNPPAWFEDPAALSWDAQQAYAEEMLLAINHNQWLAQLESLQFFVQAEALVLPLAAVHTERKLDAGLLKQKSKLEIIAAERCSGQTSYAKRLIVDAWAEAAVKQSVPPDIVWLRNGSSIKIASIFDGVEQSPAPLPDKDLHQLQALAHKDLSYIFNLYIKGKQVARNWRDLAKKLNTKYAEQGGIAARIKQLQNHQKDTHARARHMQVLHSIWLRQVELVPVWSKVFDIFPGWQQRRLHRLYVFFKQNFPDDKVHGLSFSELEILINDKLQRSKNSERFVADALYQTESDLRQLELVKDKFLQWAASYQADITDIDSAEYLLETTMRSGLEISTLHYWQVYFALNPEQVLHSNQKPSKINSLIVEHAEYISPTVAAEVLAISERAIIMGSYSAISTPRFPVALDFELAKHYGLAECDADYEDLQFDGVSASLGNLWGLATAGREADKTFAGRDNSHLAYQFSQVDSYSEDYFGSKINIGEVKSIIDWLEQNYASNPSVIIFTTFSGQAQYLQNLLASTRFANISVRLAQVPSFANAHTCLFSPVYTARDPGPYSFDRGVEIFDNLFANVSKKIIVFGDRAIFKPQLHSASGMFAKKLFAAPELQLLQEAEVQCV